MRRPDETGARIGFFWFTPGWSRANAATVWAASFFTIGLAAFLSLVQPYLLNAVLDVPLDQQGSVTGTLGFAQELLVIALAGFMGGWSDRVGRRRVYWIGFLMMAAGYLVYPLAGNIPELLAFRLVFAVGIAMAPLMLSACVVDSPQEVSRGRWIGSNNFFQGLGVVLAAGVLARSPAWFAARGADPVMAGRYACWLAAALCLLAAAIVASGLPGPGGPPARRGGSLAGNLRTAVRHGFGNPRLVLAYGAAFIGRGDFTILGAFFSLWVTQVGLEAGLPPAAAVALGGMLFGIVQLAALLWGLGMGFIVDRLNRVTALCIALALAATAYGLLGQVEDPFGRGFIPVALLVGIGEISVIVTSGALLGQEVPRQDRGAIVGFYNAVGGVGILFATYVGGRVFDLVGRTAPFTLMALLNAVLLLAALATRLRAGDPAAAPESRTES